MSEKEKLGVLLATHGDNIESALRRVMPQLSRCSVLVSHQTSDETHEHALPELQKQNITYSHTDSIGLSRNRNNCLDNLTQEINLFTDDDVEFVPDFERAILEEYQSHPKADIITFRVERGEHKSKEHRDHFEHDKWSIRHVPSIGITFRAQSLKRVDVLFDERFGLGGKYKSGEEVVFLKDCLDQGLKLLHIDKPIVRHTHLSSGWIWDKDQVQAKVATAWYLYGPIVSLLGVLWLGVTKRSLYRQHMSVFGFFATVFATWFRIMSKGL